jgi:hypothetical protein
MKKLIADPPLSAKHSSAAACASTRSISRA